MSSKAIKFEYEGEKYILSFDKSTVSAAERAGFSLDKWGDEFVTQSTLLFRSAFLKHHPRIKQAKTDEILANIVDKEGLFKALLECYQDPIEAYMEDPSEENSKKVEWKVM